MEIEIKRCKLTDIELSPELPALLAEYGAESSNDEIGPVSPQLPTYRAMEAANLFHAFGAWKDGRLIGFMFLLLPVLPHFGRMVGVTESYFVASVHRKTGAGTLLRQAAELVAETAGAAGLLVSAPTGGVLEKVLPGCGYTDMSSVFFKGFK